MTSDEKFSGTFVSGHSRARLAVMFLALNIAFDLVSVASLLSQAQLLLKVQVGDTVTQAEALTNDSRQQLISWLQILVYLVTAIIFLMWIHRAYRNLKALGARTTTYSPGWAVGYFFVPFLNLVRPYEVVKEIWRDSNPDVGIPDDLVKHRGLSLGQYSSTTSLIGLWWGFWLASNFVTYLTARFSRNASDPNDFLIATYGFIAGDLLSVVAAVAAILVIKKIDAMQEEKHARLSTPPPPRVDLVAGQPA
ncbi:MAG TPA: DUF4328 domain-containing protein [Blastocatellia bacterium]|nr:DUF4328 domain-containing protein [Blastocatellia bacterium]